jgi:aryl-alcohol dehydrogenase-like predicted oxidoreductase
MGCHGRADSQFLGFELCAAHGLGFIPWYPIASGDLSGTGGPLAAIARHVGSTPEQVALAWPLRCLPVVLPIPGTASVEHLEENVAAAAVKLDDSEFEALSKARQDRTMRVGAATQSVRARRPPRSACAASFHGQAAWLDTRTG